MPAFALRTTLGAASSCIALVAACSGSVTEGGGSSSGGLPGSTAANPSTSGGSGTSSSGVYSSSSSSGGPSSSGATGSSSSSGAHATSSSGGPIDAGNGPSDASVRFDAAPAPAGLAGFAFVVDGLVQSPKGCPAENWEFSPPPGQQPMILLGSDAASTSPVAVCTFTPPCPGLASVLLVNTSQFPLAYTAETTWNGSGYPPGVAFGGANELAGVLDPGAHVDITSVYVGGTVAVLGSSHPFSSPDASKYAGDEGTIPWPAGVAGSGGAAQMFVAEIEVVNSCIKPNTAW